MSTKLFGTDGIRGIANQELTPEIAFRLGEAVVHFLADGPNPTFVVGRDTRRSGTMLQTALSAGITSAGGNVAVCRIVPTPAVAHLVRELQADGGIVISASHNPPEYNGLKVFSREGLKLPDELEDAIEEFLVSGDPVKRPTGADIGQVRMVKDALDRYVAHALSSYAPEALKGLRVGIDCGHGASGKSSVKAFEALGAEVVALNACHNGDDINVQCGSTHMGSLAEVVKSQSLDVGIAHDGDADRMLAIDELGNEVDGDQIIAILAKHMAQRDELANNVVVTTIMCNLGFEKAMEREGISAIKTKVGDRYVLEQMQAMGANLGGEQSGHIIMLDKNSTGDGLATALALCAVIVETRASLSELAQVMTKYPQVLVNVPVAHKHHLTASVAIAQAVSEAEAALGDSGRVLVRASGTEPLVRVMAEAADLEQATEIVNRLVDVVKTELS